ncbi:Twinkle-like protein, chloroplastic/mitochondrial [Vitis vinifera]|uniref:Twinkle-like protein, chloroplastic/mitochondrial n=1 Tax=Vitis vinifera TaxID=29760 RepID=A0A438E0D1_VITVI|nr:Twinkle-like protein, chloroplastic/mitochondrial [Vitis vinifera]
MCEREKERVGRAFPSCSGGSDHGALLMNEHSVDALFAALSQTPSLRPSNASSSTTEASHLLFTHHPHGLQTPPQTHSFHAASQVKPFLARHHLRLSFKTQLQNPPNLPQNLRLTLYFPFQIYSENPEDTSNSSARLNVLKKKLEVIGFDTQMLKIGHYSHLTCPTGRQFGIHTEGEEEVPKFAVPCKEKCKGGDSMEKSLSLFITLDGDYAVWVCHQGKCGWRGNIRAFVNDSSSYGSYCVAKEGQDEWFSASFWTEWMLFFSIRFIIAFTYRRNGVLVSCKYRDVNKNFWQEKDTEKIFYGVDDIKEASDIIIVEGEIDKLSMEEAGFYNCVSVPDRAPPSVSTKVFESEEKMVCNVQCQRTLLMDPYQKEGLLSALCDAGEEEKEKKKKKKKEKEKKEVGDRGALVDRVAPKRRLREGALPAFKRGARGWRRAARSLGVSQL